jgi:hypothetical protein
VSIEDIRRRHECIAASVGLTVEELYLAAARATADAVAAGRLPAEVSDEAVERAAAMIREARRRRRDPG